MALSQSTVCWRKFCAPLFLLIYFKVIAGILKKKSAARQLVSHHQVFIRNKKANLKRGNYYFGQCHQVSVVQRWKYLSNICSKLLKLKWDCRKSVHQTRHRLTSFNFEMNPRGLPSFSEGWEKRETVTGEREGGGGCPPVYCARRPPAVGPSCTPLSSSMAAGLWSGNCSSGPRSLFPLCVSMATASPPSICASLSRPLFKADSHFMRPWVTDIRVSRVEQRSTVTPSYTQPLCSHSDLAPPPGGSCAIRLSIYMSVSWSVCPSWLRKNLPHCFAHCGAPTRK